MTRYSLKVPQFQILLGGVDITDAVVGFSFRHPLAEPSTPLIWTGTIEMYPVRSGLARSFFDDELNASRWLSGLQPIDVYFNGTWWQRFRIKPSGYRFNQDNGQAEIEITDIIGILDSYQPSADAPEFKTGQDNRWNDLAVKLINKQATLMGATVSVETPPYGIGGYYQIPRTVSGSYIKEAQKMAGERGFWMWCDKEVIKWAEYPQAAQNIVWRRSRKELLGFTRQQGLDPVKSKITISATHEEVDTCGEVYPKKTYVFASSAVVINSGGSVGQRYQTIASITIEDKIIAGNYIYTLSKKIAGNPMLTLFGGVLEANGTLIGNPPEAKGYKVTKENAFGGFAFIYKYTKGTTSFTWDWTRQQQLLDERDVTTYENVPLDAQNASKILKRVVTRSEPYAKFSEGLQYFDVSSWFVTNVNQPSYVTERTTTTYKYNEIFRGDIIVTAGQKLYEIDEIVEFKEQIYFKKNAANVFPSLEAKPVPQSKTVTKYIKECQGRWKEIKEVWQNKGQSTTSTGYLYSVDRAETPVTAIPDIIYRPAPFPVRQKPLLGAVETGYAGVSPFVNSNEFTNASTLTTKAECEQYARYLGKLKWQRYYGRELAGGFGTTLGYAPFQGVNTGNGAYIRDRFGVSLNQERDSWQFVEDCVGNKTGTIPEVQAPPLPYPPILISTLNIGAIANLSFVQNSPISPVTFYSAGGQAPYTYSSTTLPTGLSLSSSGVLSGTPTAIATTPVTVTVTDSLSATAATTFNIAVVAAPVPRAIVEVTQTIEILIVEDISMVIVEGIPIPIEVLIGADIDIQLEVGNISSRLLSSNYASLTNATFSRLINRNYLEIASSSPLLDGLFSYWNLDETGGDTVDRADSVGSYPFDDLGIFVTDSTGIIGNGVLFPEMIATGISTVTDSLTELTIAFWFSANSGDTSGTRILLRYPLNAIVDYEVNSSDELLFYGGGSLLSANLYSTGTFYLIVISWESGTSTASVYINDSFEGTFSAGISTGNDLNFESSPYIVDEVGLWDRELTSGERTELYNAGAGITYPF